MRWYALPVRHQWLLISSSRRSNDVISAFGAECRISYSGCFTARYLPPPLALPVYVQRQAGDRLSEHADARVYCRHSHRSVRSDALPAAGARRKKYFFSAALA